MNDATGPTPGRQGAMRYEGRVVARLAVLGLAACALVDVLQMALAVVTRWSLGNEQHFVDGAWYPPEILFEVESALIMGNLVSLLFTAIVFLIWFSRVYRHAASLRPLEGGAVIAWIIPFANLWLPYARIKEVWSTLTTKPLGLVRVWYAFWLLRAFSGQASRVLSVDTVDDITALQTMLVGACIIDFVAAITAARLVLALDSAARGEAKPSAF